MSDLPVSPYLEIENPGWLKDGRAYFRLSFHDDDGGVINVWDGTSYEAAILAAEGWEEDGIRVVDTVGGVS